MGERRGVVIWLTGLSGAGKSTLASVLAGRLRALGRDVTVLDGDELRRTVSRDLGFSREDRLEQSRRIVGLALEAARRGEAVIVAAITPYRSSRAEARRILGELGAFVEVYLRCPIDVLRQRDPKGLYRRGDAGELRLLTGVTDVYEEPEAAEVVIDTSATDVEREVDTLLAALRSAGSV